MAKKATATVAEKPAQIAVDPADKPALTPEHVTLVGAIIDAEAEGGAERPFMMLTPTGDVAPLLAHGYVVNNPGITDLATGAVAHRTTQEGIVWYESMKQQETEAMSQAAFSAGAPVGQPAVVATATAPAVVARSFDFEIETGVTMPVSDPNRPGVRQPLYPFDRLEVGQSFFVPVSADKPEPWKSMASTVNQATARYDIPDPKGGERVNRKGTTVANMLHTKIFKLYKGEKQGIQGARVFRTQ